MSLEEAIRERLLDIPALVSAVGTRIFNLVLQQNWTSPAIRFQLIGGHRGDQHLRGPEGHFETRLQVDTYVHQASGIDALESARTIADSVRGDGLGDTATGLWGWIGESGGEIRFENVTLEFDGAPYWEPPELRDARVRQEYLVKWRAA